MNRTNHEAIENPDLKFLDRLFEKGIPDPCGKKFITFKMPAFWLVGQGKNEADVEGWLAPAAGDKPAGVLLTWGGSVSAPQKYQNVDFLDMAQKYVANYDSLPISATKPVSYGISSQQALVCPYPRPTLAYAAWAHRLGDEALAAKLLRLARKNGGNEDALISFQPNVGTLYSCAESAFQGRSDHEALAFVQQADSVIKGRFGKTENFPPEFRSAVEEFRQELLRRQKTRHFGKAPSPLPADIDNWPLEKRVAFLIDCLDEVDVQQNAAPGGVEYWNEPLVLALIRCGDPAIPALLDAVEKDNRLTRSKRVWRFYCPGGHFLRAREPALCAVESILRKRFFEPESTSDSFTAHGPDFAKKLAGQLREYWAAYGKMSLPQRLMKDLTDPNTPIKKLQEAAYSLVTVGDLYVLSTTDGGSIGMQTRAGPNPSIEMFKNPTAAEAILAAMDRDIAQYKDIETKLMFREMYRDMLVTLGDRRIVDALKKRIETENNLPGRLDYALTCQRLGDSGPIGVIAALFSEGKLYPGEDLPILLRKLDAARTKACENALSSIAKPDHPFHKKILDYFRSSLIKDEDGQIRYNHIFCIRFLRELLDDNAPTGCIYVRTENNIKQREGTFKIVSESPYQMGDSLLKKAEVAERISDLAAMELNAQVFGLTYCHPLAEDSDRRMAALREELDKYMPVIRPVFDEENSGIGMGLYIGSEKINGFVPEISLLGRPATEKDVTDGKAIFHLGGKGQVADVKLPATGILKKDQEKLGNSMIFGHNSKRFFIVQAEKDADGKVFFGIIEENNIRKVPLEDVVNILPLESAASQPGQTATSTAAASQPTLRITGSVP
ncbi:MAG: hypothetical protein HZA50_01600 [Planctomycetes bacterium]|nr:hypothetical protein [Planctomycetota bacterium]